MSNFYAIIFFLGFPALIWSNKFEYSTTVCFEDHTINKVYFPPRNLQQLKSNTNVGINIDVTYVNFPDSVQNAFQYAVDIWAGLLKSEVTLNVRAEFLPRSEGSLASAGSLAAHNFMNAPDPNVLYALPLAERFAGVSLNTPDDFDSFIFVNSDIDYWYLGTDGNTPSDKIDMVSVILHELVHTLGFSNRCDYDENDSTQGTWGIFRDDIYKPERFGEFMHNGAAQRLYDQNIFPNPSTALLDEFVSGNIFFDGPKVQDTNEGEPVRLYAPSEFKRSSSLSHLDNDQFPDNDPNNLMTPGISRGEAIHDPGDITLGILQDIGWELNTVATDLLSNQTVYKVQLSRLNQNTWRLFYDQGIQRVEVFNILGSKESEILFNLPSQEVLIDHNSKAVILKIYTEHTVEVKKLIF